MSVMNNELEKQHELLQKIQQLEAENASLKLDADRYRFLRDVRQWIDGIENNAWDELASFSLDEFDKFVDFKITEYNSYPKR